MGKKQGNKIETAIIIIWIPNGYVRSVPNKLVKTEHGITRWTSDYPKQMVKQSLYGNLTEMLE